MTDLDAEFAAGLAQCASRDLVVSHEAFGYLADAYDLTQIGISGLSPEAEPSPARMREVADLVRANGVTTIYYETLVDPKVAQTIADETGAQTAVLDPLEGLVEGSTGDYASVMPDNLATLRRDNPAHDARPPARRGRRDRRGRRRLPPVRGVRRRACARGRRPQHRPRRVRRAPRPERQWQDHARAGDRRTAAVSHGSVRLFGQPLSRVPDWQRIALVPQRLPGATSIPVSVWETVLSGLISPRRRWRPFSRTQRGGRDAPSPTSGCGRKRHDRLDTLSGGQQRRVLIARALASGADLLVMDEPTAGVDAANVAHLTELLARLHEQGTTVVVVTHELTGISHLITRAVVLGTAHRGSVVFDGPPPVPGQLLHDHVHHHEADGDAPSVVGLEP